MIGFLDVAYGVAADRATAAVVLASDWGEGAPVFELVVSVDHPAPYEPGEFYRRELPPLLAVLAKLPALPEVLVIDGFVWLDSGNRLGLGAHLHRALNARCAIVGVAKSRFLGAGPVREILRGKSQRPLFISAVGLDLGEAAEAILRMHCAHRIPTLIRLVDRLSRAD